MNAETERKNDNDEARRVALRRRIRRALARARAGMTLIEIMVVVIIMGLIMSAVGFGVFNQLKKAKVKDALTEIDVVRSAVRLYENDHPNQCPTIDQLRDDGILDRGKASTDPWGHAFTINCEGDVSVTSNGPDGQPGTADDLPGNQQ